MSGLVWYYAKLSSNSALFVQPYSLLNDAITEYNGACAKIVFTARRHALARSLLSAGVRPSVLHINVLYCIQTAEDIIKYLSQLGSLMILVFDPQALLLHRGCKLHRAVCDFGLKSPFISETVGDKSVVARER